MITIKVLINYDNIFIYCSKGYSVDRKRKVLPSIVTIIFKFKLLFQVDYFQLDYCFILYPFKCVSMSVGIHGYEC